MELAQTNLARASKRYAQLYNRKARSKNFKVGNQVLILLPKKSNKLLVHWRGPYPILEKVGPLDYRIQMERKVKTFHANLLKLYVERTEEENVVSIAFIDAESEDNELNSQELCIDMSDSSTKGEYHLSPSLTNNQKRTLIKLLFEFQDVLSDKPGYTSLAEHEIRLNTATPIRAKPHPIPYNSYQTVLEEIDSMISMGVIEPSESSYCSNFVIVKKPDGTNRFCIDFRQINRCTVFDCEPIPNMDDIFVKLTNCKFISKLDLTKGYWQMPLTESSKPLTAFQTPKGLFQFRTMPFGLVCATASFCRLVRKLLNGMTNVDSYIDDIIVFTETFEKHLQILSELFHRLREANLTVKPNKCYFGNTNINCLGHVVGDNKLEPNPDKISVIKEAVRPENKKQVRAFLGLIGFYRRFVPNFASVAASITDLTKKGQPHKVMWGLAQELSFNTLKNALCTTPILKLPDLTEPFILQTDASQNGLGAILLQKEEDVRKPVAYASRKLNKAEVNYSTVEKECLACVWAIQKFQRYLYGREFTLETDHQPLVFLSKSKLTNSRLMRWALLLQPYKFHVVSIPGKQNVAADYLSRM